jgi:hypothetical protein
MKYVYLAITVTLLQSCAAFQNTPRDLVASKCRLHLPMKAGHCEAAGIHPMWHSHGQLSGLPVSEMEYGMDTVQLLKLPEFNR